MTNLHQDDSVAKYSRWTTAVTELVLLSHGAPLAPAFLEGEGGDGGRGRGAPFGRGGGGGGM